MNKVTAKKQILKGSCKRFDDGPDEISLRSESIIMRLLCGDTPL